MVLGLMSFLAISGLFLWLGEGAMLANVLTGFAIFAGGLGAGAHFLKKRDDE